MAVLSGLAFTGDMNEDSKAFVGFSLFSRWIAGLMETSDEEKELARRVVRVLILGQSIGRGKEVSCRFLRPFLLKSEDFASAARYLVRNDQSPNVACMAFLDKLLCKLTVRTFCLRTCT